MSFGLEMGSSIIVSDSLPLLALFFKLLSPLLPGTFQYFGLWIFLCFVLQAWFAWKLIGLVSDNNMVRLLASGIFVFSPPMLARLHGHCSLVGHWLILAALYITLHKGRSNGNYWWLALIFVSIGIHANLFFMVSALWLADLSRRIIFRKFGLYRGMAEAAAVMGTTLFTLWLYGFFLLPLANYAAGFGFYKMNLLSLINANGWGGQWSYVLSGFPQHPGEYEGFNYLGLGSLLAAGIVLFSCKPSSIAVKKEWIPLVVVSALLFLLALTHKIGIANKEVILSFVPERLMDFLLLFRSSGRMFWPVYYLITFSIIRALIIANPARLVFILLILFAVQAADTSIGWTLVRDKRLISQGSEWVSPLSSGFWKEASGCYKKLRYVPITHSRKGWKVFAYYAYKNNMSTDSVYVARIPHDRVRQARKKTLDAVTSNNLDRETLYILEPEVKDKVFQLSGKDLFAEIDGYYVLAPDWRDCSQNTFGAVAVELSP